MNRILLTFLLSLAIQVHSKQISPQEMEFFETKIRPVLADNCYKCHAVDSEKLKGGLLLDSKWGWEKGGDSGAVIIPGKANDSLLIKMIHHDPDVEAMPPKNKLSAEQIKDFEKWVSIGAPDPRPKKERTKVDAHAYNLEKRKQWWSLQPIKDYPVPHIKQETWPRQDIDNFILANLEAKNWQPAATAEKRDLLKRVYYDLTGLPPTVAEQEAFEKDFSSEAYEKVVDRLLASPRFGEHWARKWMDLMRYAETKAFEQDYTMAHVDRYRDYLIRVFNDDITYEQMVMEAFAGDIIEARLDKETGENESLKGPGFFYLTDGHHGPADLHLDEVRLFDNMIDVIGKTFQATTISCARCHDHKFDAVAEKDFYSLYGIIASSRRDMRNSINPNKITPHFVDLRKSKEAIKQAIIPVWEKDLQVLKKKLLSIAAEGEINGEQRKIKKIIANKHRSINSGLYPLHIALIQNERVAKQNWIKVNSANKLAENTIGELNTDSIGNWTSNGLGFGNVPKKTGDFVVSQSKGKIIQSFVGDSMAAGELGSRMDGSLQSDRFILDGNPIYFKVKGRKATVSLVVNNYELVGFGPTTSVLNKNIDSDEWQVINFPTSLWKGSRAYIDVRLNGLANRPIKYNYTYHHRDDSYIAFEKATFGKIEFNTQKAWGKFKSLEKRQERIAEIISKADLALKHWGTGTQNEGEDRILDYLLNAGLLKNTIQDVPEAKVALMSFRKQIESMPLPSYVRTLSDGKGYDEPVYIRGLHTNLSKEPNPRHFIDGIDATSYNAKGSGRLEWALSVVDKKNPLTSRVMANRIWYHIFGRGIVSSVDDFGQMGSLPSHPELLDFLAKDFVKNKWSIKSLIRKLVLSSTYRMSSGPSSEALLNDPTNIYLQHMPIRRMEAEAVRDTILSISGRLNNELYGKSIAVNLHETPNSRSKPRKSGPMDGEGRRSIYLELRRNFLPGFLTAFDMPNATEPFGKRNVTNVPAQSLTLMNDPFVTEQALVWAKALMLRKDLSFDQKVKQMHKQAFCRPASNKELEWAQKTFAGIAKTEFNQSFDQALNNEKVWQHFCHVMFNRKEMIFKF
ncbi:DUF1553 domain-containing protein [Lentisphaera profundi]|uniref:DUF1553 domain-containing protein n=1 Tax=Lentisphaera profundi TaxID=1658616 RepID=A0ABY7VUA7_9BACT|nr:DUF1553 domain-containing protein [Lentisphaera profundi]WDE95698.1 DUF1553 domain-containing protein [Lentisphaera profundi]